MVEREKCLVQVLTCEIGVVWVKKSASNCWNPMEAVERIAAFLKFVTLNVLPR